jgi:preprotein translocase subunit SecG
VFGFLLTLVILDGLLLSVVVLLQAGKGDGLAAMGGSGSSMADGLLGGRQAATLLTKTTWTTGGIFLGLLVVLSIMSSRARTPTPLLQDEFGAQAQPQPLLPGPGDTGGATIPGVTGSNPPAATTSGQQSSDTTH